MEKETKHTPKMRLIKNALVLRAEIDRLKEENERLKKENKVIYGSEMVQLSDYQDLKKEREELVKALERIYNPIKWMQDNLQPGEVINVQTAVQLSDSASYLKSIAYSTLSRIKK